MTNSYNWTHRKLTFAQAEEIRLEYRSDHTPVSKIAARYGVSPSTIQRVLERRCYTKPTPLEVSQQQPPHQTT